MRKTAQKSGWKAANNSRKTAQKTKLAITVLLAIIAIILFGNLIKFANNLFQPISSTQKGYSWDGSSKINLVIKSGKIAVLTFDPHIKEVIAVDIPSETYVEVPGSYGSWQVRAVFDLGQSESPPKGPGLLKDTAGLLLGLPIDGYLEVEGQTTKEVVEDLRNPVQMKNLLKSLKTDLTPVELTKLVFGLSGVRFDKFKFYDFEETPDLLGLDSQIVQEEATIAIFNATDTPGLASKAARIVSNIGGNVIIQANSETKLAKSVIVGKDGFTKKRLQQIFCKEAKCDSIAEGFEFRAQLNIVLGQDFAK